MIYAKYPVKEADLPAEKIAAMQQYAVKLRGKFPHMKPDRISRKVAEHFHIKLIPHAENE